MSAIAAPAVRTLITAKEFSRLPEPADGLKQELVRGEIVTMPQPGFLHGVVQLNVALQLKGFVKTQNSGRMTVESGLMTEQGPDTVRGPDVAYWSYDRLPRDQTPVGYPEVAADLCVEVLSPSNTTAELTRKVREYLAAGVRLVWVVDPKMRTVSIYRKPGEGRILWDDAAIDGEDVLPGFSCPVASFFE